MPGDTRWCYVCRQYRPFVEFQALEGAGKEFYKLCEPCRAKSRNRHRKLRISRLPNAGEQRRKAQPYYCPERVTQTNININNPASGVVPTTTSAGTTDTMPEQITPLQAVPNSHSWFTVAPPVVESSAQSTTTRTTITISTTTTNNGAETPMKSEEDTKTEEDVPKPAASEYSEPPPSEPSLEQQSAVEPSAKERREPFNCLHCEKLRPWPLAALHICLMCIRDWKWCDKGSHNQAKANFLWNGEEHDECYVCYFAGE